MCPGPSARRSCTRRRTGRRRRRPRSSASVHSVSPEYAMNFPPYSTRSAYDGEPLEWRTSNGVTRAGPNSRGVRSVSSTNLVSNARSTVAAPGYKASNVRWTRSRTPAGPAIRSGFVRSGELSVEDQPGQPGEVVAVEMAERNEPDRVRVDARSSDRDERGRAAVEQHRLGATVQVEAGLKAPATGERVAGAEERELHRSEVVRIGRRGAVRLGRGEAAASRTNGARTAPR